MEGCICGWIHVQLAFLMMAKGKTLNPSFLCIHLAKICAPGFYAFLPSLVPRIHPFILSLPIQAQPFSSPFCLLPCFPQASGFPAILLGVAQRKVGRWIRGSDTPCFLTAMPLILACLLHTFIHTCHPFHPPTLASIPLFISCIRLCYQVLLCHVMSFHCFHHCSFEAHQPQLQPHRGTSWSLPGHLQVGGSAHSRQNRRQCHLKTAIGSKVQPAHHQTSVSNTFLWELWGCVVA